MANPAQPSLNQAYTTQGNPAETAPAEDATASRTAEANANAGDVERRVPAEQSSGQDATPTSLAQGIHGGAPVDSTATAAKGRQEEGDAAQMGAPGEGKVADAVQEKPGASGSAPDLAGDLDRKKAEQESLREEEGRPQEKINVQKILDERAGSS